MQFGINSKYFYSTNKMGTTCFVVSLITHLKTAFISHMAFFCMIVKKKTQRLTIFLMSPGIFQ
jgi:hypothetical protein